MVKRKKGSKRKSGMDARVKRMDTMDIALTKWSVAAVVLFLITAFPKVLEIVLKIHWGFYLVFAILFALRPMKRFWGN